MLFKSRKRVEKSLEISHKEKESLLQQIDQLKEELAQIVAERDEVLKAISNFELEYNKRLGKYLQRLLVLRMDKAKREASADPSKQSRYEETVDDYEQFNKKSHDLNKKEYYSLNEEDTKKIKQVFRRAARLCHPDTVTEDSKEKSKTIFIALRQAYERNDLEEVEHIAEQLAQEKDINIKSMESQEIKSLKRVASTLEKKIDLTHNEMIEIMSSETYQLVTSGEDLEVYFENLKEQLEMQIQLFENNASL